jgi:hypothetical protein
MSATALFATVPYVRPLCDTRPARGKHRNRGVLAARLHRTWRSARAEFALAAATLGAVTAAVLS